MTLSTSAVPSVRPASRAFPRVHPRPAQGWLNDPNGLCRVDGTWHVFFQYNPHSSRHDAIHWGHLSSMDLVIWQEEPIALSPQRHGPDAFGCWSGVVTVDQGRPVAVYSGVEAADNHSRVTLATGTPDLRAWHQEGATAAGMPEDPRVVAVRDPFVFHFAGRRYALQGAGLADGRAAILLYDATDLRTWSYLGVWLTSDHPVLSEDLNASIWECPQLFEVPEGKVSRWVLIISRWMRQEDGSGRLQDVRYVVGRLDMGFAENGRTEESVPRFSPEAVGAVDTGTAFYAPQILALEDRTLLWGWSWETRPEEESDEEGWSGLLTWPRELRLAGNVLVSTPATECAGYRRQHLDLGSSAGAAIELPDAFELRSTGQDASLRLLLRGPAGEREVWAGSAATVVGDSSVVEVYVYDGPSHTFRAYPRDGEAWCLQVDPGSVSGWELGPSTP